MFEDLKNVGYVIEPGTGSQRVLMNSEHLGFLDEHGSFVTLPFYKAHEVVTRDDNTVWEAVNEIVEKKGLSADLGSKEDCYAFVLRTKETATPQNIKTALEYYERLKGKEEAFQALARQAESRQRELLRKDIADVIV